MRIDGWKQSLLSMTRNNAFTARGFVRLRCENASSTVEPDLVFHVKRQKSFLMKFPRPAERRAFCCAETINNSLNKFLQIHFHEAFEAR
jgi:hypothetical protein